MIGFENSKFILNVGGQIFETTRSTINKYPDTTLAKIIGELGTPDDRGIYFIDRNPKIFRGILEYYRTDRLVRPTKIDRELWEHELDYWGLPKVPSEKNEKVKPKISNIEEIIDHTMIKLYTGTTNYDHKNLNEILTNIYFGIKIYSVLGYNYCVIKENKIQLSRLGMRDFGNILTSFFGFSKLVDKRVPKNYDLFPDLIFEPIDLSNTEETIRIFICYF